jgi:ABC-2 type transport system permease protein
MTRLILHQLRYDLRSFSRNRQAAFSTLLLPILLLVILVNVGDRTAHGAELYVPGLIAFATMSASFISLVVDLVAQREAGVLKRRLASPVPPWVLIAARMLAAVIASIAAAFVLLAVAGNAYNVPVPASALPGVIVTTVLGAGALSALAYALASAIRSVASAQPVVALVVLPVLVISGVLVPTADLPHGLAVAARVLPLEHLAHGLRSAFDSGAPLGVSPVDALVLAAWSAAGALIAATRFNWLPTR